MNWAIKGSPHVLRGSFHLVSSGLGSGKKAADPLSQLFQCLSRSRNIKHTGSVPYLFILFISAQSSLGHTKLVCLICLCVSQVACHPAPIKPGIREARTTAIWSGSAQGVNHDIGVLTEITPPPQCCILTSLSGPEKLHNPRGLVWQP